MTETKNPPPFIAVGMSQGEGDQGRGVCLVINNTICNLPPSAARQVGTQMIEWADHIKPEISEGEQEEIRSALAESLSALFNHKPDGWAPINPDAVNTSAGPSTSGVVAETVDKAVKDFDDAKRKAANEKRRERYARKKRRQ